MVLTSGDDLGGSEDSGDMSSEWPQPVSDGFSTDVSDRAPERAQEGVFDLEWETDYGTDVSESRKRKGRSVVKSSPAVA